MQRPATPQPRLLNRSCTPQNSGSEPSDPTGMGGLNQELMNTYVKNVLKPVYERDPTAYAFVVNQLRNASTGKSRVVAGWLRALASCASALDLKNARELLAEVFRMDFTTSPDVQDAYMNLVTELCTSHSTYVQTIFQSLFSRLKPKEQERLTMSATPTLFTSSAGSGLTTPTVSAFERSESVRGAIIPTVIDIVELVPMSTPVLADTLVKMYPHKALSLETHRAWASTVLDLARTLPSIRDPLLAVVIRSVVQMDADLKVSCNDEQLGSIVTPAPTADFDAVKNKLLADKLDSIMCLLFSFIEDRISESDTDNFNTLLSCFVQYVLPTHRPKVVQFLIFKACAVCPKYAEMFLDCLVEKLRDESLPILVRASACSYVACFLARSKSISSPKVVETYIRELLSVAHKYSSSFIESIKADNKEASKTCSLSSGRSISPSSVLLSSLSLQETIVDPTAHAFFYTAVQSSMYALCYAYRESLKMKNRGMCSSGSGESEAPEVSPKWLESLGFARVLSSPLNPLHVCDPAIVEEFQGFWEAVTGSDSSLRAAASLAESNNSIMLLQGAYDGRFEESPFTPFDPYLLRESAKHIDPVYNFWTMDDAVVGGGVGKEVNVNVIVTSDCKCEVKDEGGFVKEDVHVISHKRPLSLKEEDDYEIIEDNNSNNENKIENFSHPLRKVAKIVKIETISNDDDDDEEEEEKEEEDNDKGDESEKDDNSDNDSDNSDVEKDVADDKGKVGVEMGITNFHFDLF